MVKNGVGVKELVMLLAAVVMITAMGVWCFAGEKEDLQKNKMIVELQMLNLTQAERYVIPAQMRDLQTALTEIQKKLKEIEEKEAKEKEKGVKK